MASALVSGCKTYNTFAGIRHTVSKLDYEKEISRLSEKRDVKTPRRTVLQDLQKYKTMIREKTDDLVTTDPRIVALRAQIDAAKTALAEAKT